MVFTSIRIISPNVERACQGKHSPEFTLTRSENGGTRIRATSRTQILQIVKVSGDMKNGNQFIPRDDGALLTWHVDVTMPEDQFPGKDLETMKLGDVNVVLNRAGYSLEISFPVRLESAA